MAAAIPDGREPSNKIPFHLPTYPSNTVSTLSSILSYYTQSSASPAAGNTDELNNPDACAKSVQCIIDKAGLDAEILLHAIVHTDSLLLHQHALPLIQFLVSAIQQNAPVTDDNFTIFNYLLNCSRFTTSQRLRLFQYFSSSALHFPEFFGLTAQQDAHQLAHEMVSARFRAAILSSFNTLCQTFSSISPLSLPYHNHNFVVDQNEQLLGYQLQSSQPPSPLYLSNPSVETAEKTKNNEFLFFNLPFRARTAESQPAPAASNDTPDNTISLDTTHDLYPYTAELFHTSHTHDISTIFSTILALFNHFLPSDLPHLSTAIKSLLLNSKIVHYHRLILVRSILLSIIPTDSSQTRTPLPPAQLNEDFAQYNTRHLLISNTGRSALITLLNEVLNMLPNCVDIPTMFHPFVMDLLEVKIEKFGFDFDAEIVEQQQQQPSPAHLDSPTDPTTTAATASTSTTPTTRSAVVLPEAKPHYHVAVGVLYNDGHICLTLRHPSQHEGGKWEFPGGKFDPKVDKSILHTLKRELYEEIGVQINVEYLPGDVRASHGGMRKLTQFVQEASDDNGELVPRNTAALRTKLVQELRFVAPNWNEIELPLNLNINTDDAGSTTDPTADQQSDSYTTHDSKPDDSLTSDPGSSGESDPTEAAKLSTLMTLPPSVTLHGLDIPILLTVQSHEFADRSVTLWFFWVDHYRGQPISPNLPLQWFKLNELTHLKVPTANYNIIQRHIQPYMFIWTHANFFTYNDFEYLINPYHFQHSYMHNVKFPQSELRIEDEMKQTRQPAMNDLHKSSQVFQPSSTKPSQSPTHNPFSIQNLNNSLQREENIHLEHTPQFSTRRYQPYALRLLLGFYAPILVARQEVAAGIAQPNVNRHARNLNLVQNNPNHVGPQLPDFLRDEDDAIDQLNNIDSLTLSNEGEISEADFSKFSTLNLSSPHFFQQVLTKTSHLRDPTSINFIQDNDFIESSVFIYIISRVLSLSTTDLTKLWSYFVEVSNVTKTPQNSTFFIALTALITSFRPKFTHDHGVQIIHQLISIPSSRMGTHALIILLHHLLSTSIPKHFNLTQVLTSDTLSQSTPLPPMQMTFRNGTTAALAPQKALKTALAVASQTAPIPTITYLIHWLFDYNCSGCAYQCAHCMDSLPQKHINTDITCTFNKHISLLFTFLLFTTRIPIDSSRPPLALLGNKPIIGVVNDNSPSLTHSTTTTTTTTTTTSAFTTSNATLISQSPTITSLTVPRQAPIEYYSNHLSTQPTYFLPFDHLFITPNYKAKYQPDLLKAFLHWYQYVNKTDELKFIFNSTSHTLFLQRSTHAAYQEHLQSAKLTNFYYAEMIRNGTAPDTLCSPDPTIANTNNRDEENGASQTILISKEDHEITIFQHALYSISRLCSLYLYPHQHEEVLGLLVKYGAIVNIPIPGKFLPCVHASPFTSYYNRTLSDNYVTLSSEQGELEIIPKNPKNGFLQQILINCSPSLAYDLYSAAPSPARYIELVQKVQLGLAGNPTDSNNQSPLTPAPLIQLPSTAITPSSIISSSHFFQQFIRAPFCQLFSQLTRLDGVTINEMDIDGFYPIQRLLFMPDHPFDVAQSMRATQQLVENLLKAGANPLHAFQSPQFTNTLSHPYHVTPYSPIELYFLRKTKPVETLARRDAEPTEASTLNLLPLLYRANPQVAQYFTPSLLYCVGYNVSILFIRFILSHAPREPFFTNMIQLGANNGIGYVLTQQRQFNAPPIPASLKERQKRTQSRLPLHNCDIVYHIHNIVDESVIGNKSQKSHADVNAQLVHSAHTPLHSAAVRSGSLILREIIAFYIDVLLEFSPNGSDSTPV